MSSFLPQKPPSSLHQVQQLINSQHLDWIDMPRYRNKYAFVSDSQSWVPTQNAGHSCLLRMQGLPQKTLGLGCSSFQGITICPNQGITLLTLNFQTIKFTIKLKIATIFIFFFNQHFNATFTRSGSIEFLTKKGCGTIILPGLS